jgi:hypothetical protein
MTAESPFSSGGTSELVPEGDVARQAVDSLRGYAYQVLASALAWVDLGETERLYLEVAEDYAVMARNLGAVQVKDTAASGSVTLKNLNVREAITSFVDLVARNPGVPVELRYLTTSTIGLEKAIEDRPAGIAGLEFWRKAAAGADVLPLRAILDSEAFPPEVRAFVQSRSDDELRFDLLQKIHWHCGAPNSQDIYEDLQERLVVLGRDRFGIPASDARRLADVLAYRVLQKSVLKKSQDRVLKRAELYEILGNAAEVAVPRASLSALLSHVAPGLAGSLQGGLGSSGALAAEQPGWLIGSDTLPTPDRFIARPALKGAVYTALEQFGAVILIGASGLGKSHLARAVAESRAGTFVIVDFRELDAAETRRRLDILFGRVGGLKVPLLILEDVNHIDDPAVARAFGRVMEALRRRDRVVLITCYRRPSAKAAADGGLNLQGTVECPYFNEQETQELVSLYGGDPDLWGRLAFFAGATGHPQLTHAFVVGMSARGWPRSELRDIINRGLTTRDIDAEREAARRSLIASLPDGARSLLYRLSLTVGAFSRAIALVVGTVPPSISQAGEALDLLVGPWIEAIGPERYRVSPLAGGAGRSQLPPDEQTRIHAAIAVQMLTGGTIDANEADRILMHALHGKAAFCLARLAMGVLTAPEESVPLLAESISIFQAFNTNILIYPDVPSISILLRLAQFRLTAASREEGAAAEAADALLREIGELEDDQLKALCEVIALGTILSTRGVSGYIDDWVSILRRFRQLFQGGMPSELVRISHETEARMGASLLGVLFSVGMMRLSSVKRLEYVIDKLSELEPSERNEFLVPVDETVADYSLPINVPWATEERHEEFDPVDALTRYSRMTDKVHPWGINQLTIQCWIARAIMLDEYLNDGGAALGVLEQAMALFGANVLLLRAKAKIFWRRDDHPKALEILRSIADEVGGENSVERAFALRDAAISAANCGDWSQARQWFADAQQAAASAQTEEMHGMAVGLRADSAVAALMEGDTGSALEGLAGALTELATIDPDSSLGAAYRHRVIRHAVLWAQSKVTDTTVRISGEDIGMLPGNCSNPNPPSSIRELPLGPLDIAWYMLAETEIAAGINEGIAHSLYTRLTGGKIPTMEIGLRTRLIQAAIEASDADGFTKNLGDYLDGMAYMIAEGGKLKGFDPTNPPRGEIPNLEPTSGAVQALASDAVLAFGMRAAYADRKGKLSQLQIALQAAFGEDYPASALFSAELPASPDLDRTVLAILSRLEESEHMEPQRFWLAGLRLFERSNQSNFGRDLVPHLATWLRTGWERIIEQEAFRLDRPLKTVPSINSVLSNPDNDRAFVASLLLTTSEAVESPLSESYTETLRAIAAGS